MELQQLKYFKSIAESGNITKTAQQLFISPPALSMSLSRLESELGVQLFDRSGHRIYLNNNGKLFLTCVNEILMKLDTTADELLDINNRAQRHISVTATSSSLWYDLFEAFMIAYPNISILHTITKPSDVSPGDLLETYDFMLANSDTLIDKSISMVKLYDDDYPVLLAPSCSPLADRKTITLEEVRHEPFIALQPGYAGRSYFDDLFAAARLTPNIAIECSYTMRMRMLRAGFGLAIMTGYSSFLSHIDDISVIRITEPMLKRSQSLFWHYNRYHSVSMQLFREFTANYFKNGVAGLVN